jgi:hypothetical protein
MLFNKSERKRDASEEHRNSKILDIMNKRETDEVLIRPVASIYFKPQPKAAYAAAAALASSGFSSYLSQFARMWPMRGELVSL